MASPTVKEILLKWNIDNTNWKKAILELSSLLEKTNKAASAASDKAAAKLEIQKQKLKEYIADQKSETSELEKQIAKLGVKAAAAKTAKTEASAKLAIDKATTAEINSQVASERQVQAVQKTIQSEVNTRLMQEKLVTAQLNSQTAAIRQQQVAYRFQQSQQARGSAGGAGGGGGFLGGLGRGLAGAFGGGLFGNVTAAIASAEGLEHAIVALAEKMVELLKETDQLSRVREQFEKLAPARGMDPVKFIDALRGATHGLVADVNLYRNANTFLQSSIHASETDILALTQATVGLARAQGRDATAAMQSLQRFFLTGRSMTLAYATGINRAYLAVGNLGRGTDATIKTQLQFKQALEAVTTQYKMIGEPTETYAEALKKVSVATNRLMEEFILGLQSSKGFQEFVGWLDKLASKMGGMSEAAAKLGKYFGDAFFVIEQVFEYLKDNLTNTGTLLATFFESLGKIFMPDTVSSEFIQRLTTVKGLLVTMAQILIILRGAMNEFALRTEYTMKEAAVSGKEAWKWLNTDIGKGSYDSAKVKAEQAKLHAEFMSKIEPMMTEEYQALVKMQENLQGAADEGGQRIKFAGAPTLYTEQQQVDAAKKLGKIKEQIAIENSKIELEQTKMKIAAEQELARIQYEQGLTSHAQYLDKKRDLDKADIEARRKDEDTEFAAKMSYLRLETQQTRELAAQKKVDAETDKGLRLFDINRQREAAEKNIREDKSLGEGDKTRKLSELTDQWQALQGMIERSYQASNRVVEAEMAEIRSKELLEAKKHLLANAKLNDEEMKKDKSRVEEEINDELAARKKLVDLEAKLKQDSLARTQQSLEKGFQEGQISPDEYFQQRVDLINQETQVSVEAARKKLAENKNSLVAEAEFAKEMAEAEMKRQKELTTLSEKEWDVRVQASEKAAKRISEVAEGQLKFEAERQKLNPWAGRGGQIEALTSLITLEEKRLEIQKAQAKALADAGLWETWAKVAAGISHTQTQLMQYNQELIKARDYSNALASSAKDIATAAALFPKGAKTAEGFSKFAQITETLSGLVQKAKEQDLARAGKSATPKTPEEVYTALEASGQKASSILQDAFNKSTQAVAAWTDAAKKKQEELTQSIEALNSAVTKLTQTMLRGPNFVGPVQDEAPPVKEGPSGMPTPTSPGGTVTQSDMQDIKASASSTTSGLVSLAGASAVATAAIKGIGDSLNQGSGGGGLMGMFDSLKGHLSDFIDGIKTQDSGQFGSGLQGMMGTGMAVAGGVGGMVSAAKGKGGPFQSGMTGAASGMQLGMMVGGPIGGAIGAGAGLITGVFAGKAEQRAEKLAKKLMAMFNAVQQEISAGTQTLAAGIQLQIKNIEDAVTQLSGKKGGRDQLKQILPQMEQQLKQLQDQQKSIIKTFDNQLDVLNLPLAYQDTGSAVQGIIDKYTQYIQAGGSVVNANKYLQDSFQKLSQEGFSQLNQDEQDAINNALNYNDLLIQRQSLIQNTNQQIQDIMSQGVAVRQMPEGVSKARQIQQLMLESSNQMDRLDEEIAVSKHKLETEQKIFGLATTRIGLETQLATLQNQQTDLDITRIKALQATVGAFQTKIPASMQAFMQQMGFGPGFISAGTEPGLKPTPPVKTGIPDVDLQNQLEYQQALAAYQLALNMPIGYISPFGTVTTTPVPISIGDTTTTAGSLESATPLGFGQQVIPTGGGVPQTISAAPAIGMAASSTMVPVWGGATASNTSARSTQTIDIGIARSATPLITTPAVDISAARVGVENQISNISAMRVASESQLVSLKMQEISADMARVQAHNDLLNRYQAIGFGKGTTLEDLMQQTYETRGRQGFGRFYGELANPT